MQLKYNLRIHDDHQRYLEGCRLFIENDFEKGAENAIYQKTIQLRELFNKNDINTNLALSLAEEIYNELIENNILSTDPKISRYSEFKNMIQEYKETIRQKDRLNEEINILGKYSISQLTQEDEKDCHRK